MMAYHNVGVILKEDEVQYIEDFKNINSKEIPETFKKEQK